MLPNLLPSDSEGRVVAVAPSPRFRPAKNIAFARPCGGDAALATRHFVGSDAQRAGVRYERQVHEFLRALWPSSYRPGPWYEFGDASGFRRCQPDGLLLQSGTAVIFEVKIRHTEGSYYQLHDLYAPVIRAAHRPKKVLLCTIVKSYDPSAPYPARTSRVENLSEWVDAGDEAIGVYQWKR